MPPAIKPESVWADAQGRQQQLDEHIRTSKSAYFGFEQVDEDEKTARTSRHFDQVAQRYDLMNTLLSFGIHYSWKRLAVRMLDLKPGDRVVDVCGGTGDLAIIAARRVGPGGSVTIFDINRTMMEAGRPKVIRERFENRISFVQGNAEYISFPDNHFDAAMVGFGIRNVTHMETGFREMHRVLKPGGKLMCLEFSKPTFLPFRWMYDLYSFHFMLLLGQLIARNRAGYLLLTESIRLFPMPDELAARLEHIGFSGVRYRPLTNGIAVIHTGIKEPGP